MPLVPARGAAIRAAVVLLVAGGLIGPTAACGSGDDRSAPDDSPPQDVTWVVTFRDWRVPTSTSTGWADRGRDVVRELRANAERSQADARRTLRGAASSWRTYWVAGAAVVTGPASLGPRLAAAPGVERVDRQATRATARDDTLDPVAPAGLADPTANLTAVGAPTAWAADQRGTGTVVGLIDTGVDATHPALEGRRRADRSWFDAVGGCSDRPCDRVGHGTMAAGLAVGTRVPGRGPAIGVAPGATWIAARACDADSCDLDDLLAAAQWMLAPTGPGRPADPAARPQVLNNSWGVAGPDPVLDRAVQAWRSAGIVVVAAAGNGGPACATVTDPASRPDVVSVGAVNDLGRPLDLSARGGPGPTPEPDLVAPGAAVVSSTTGGAYARGDGTSFAAPQVAGAAAVLRGALPDPLAPGSDDAVMTTLRADARPLPADEPCGPGTVTGAGLLDLTPR
ncbi:MAG: S8 family serine peptidase [Microthrixaceae bacterium]